MGEEKALIFVACQISVKSKVCQENFINTSERNRGMDIHQLKQRIDASGKKLVTLGNEYIKSKDEIAARKVLVKMFGEISQQTLLLGEQNAELDKKMLRKN